MQVSRRDFKSSKRCVLTNQRGICTQACFTKPGPKPQAANPQTRNVAFLALRAVFQMSSPSRFKQLGWIVVFEHLAVFSNAVGG